MNTFIMFVSGCERGKIAGFRQSAVIFRHDRLGKWWRRILRTQRSKLPDHKLVVRIRVIIEAGESGCRRDAETHADEAASRLYRVKQ